MTTVVNIHRGNPYDILIDRTTPWGNPFPVLHQSYSRLQSVQQFNIWVRSKPDLVARIRRELRGKVLGCHCKPLLCHGDVLAKIADEPDEE